MQKKIFNFCILFLMVFTSFAQNTGKQNANGDSTKLADAAAASGDNTMLYVGIGIVALLAIGYFVMQGRKKE